MLGSVGLKDILHAGGPVLLFLIGLSIYSIALIWERWVVFRRFHGHLESADRRIRRGEEVGKLDKALDYLRMQRNPIHWILDRVSKAGGSREDRRELAALAIERQVNKLRASLPTLGTIGSISPFIGLFGTILGVMRAFRDLGQMKGAGPEVVAVGISEALIATAAGLFVAIPAIVAYNVFSRKAQHITDELTWLAEEVLDRVAG